MTRNVYSNHFDNNLEDEHKKFNLYETFYAHFCVATVSFYCCCYCFCACVIVYTENGNSIT